MTQIFTFATNYGCSLRDAQTAARDKYHGGT